MITRKLLNANDMAIVSSLNQCILSIILKSIYIFPDTDTDFSESEGLSSLQISGPPKSSAISQSADESGL